MGKELAVSLAKLSKLPSLKEAKEQIAKGKLNPTGSLMADTIKQVEGFLNSDTYTKASAKEAVLQAWLDGERKAATEKTRKLIFDIAQTTFALIVGQVWFNEFSSIDENSMDLTIDGQTIACKAEMKDVQYKI